jgi:hypothetical protein
MAKVAEVTMKRWLCCVFLVVGVVFFLWSPHRPVSPPSYPLNQTVPSHNEFVSTWCPALRAASPAFLRNRAGPLEFFAIQFGFLIADIMNDGPPWLDNRGPPSPHRCSHPLVTGCQAAGQAGSQSGTPPRRNFRPGPRLTRRRGFGGVEKRRSDGSLPVAVGEVFTSPPQSGLAWF